MKSATKTLALAGGDRPLHSAAVGHPLVAQHPTNRVLITANRLRLAELLEKGLQQHGWLTLIVNDVQELWNLANSTDCQCLILDLDLLYESGVLAVDQLLQREWNLPILAITSAEELGDRAFRQLGTVMDVLVKPFRMHELLERVG